MKLSIDKPRLTEEKSDKRNEYELINQLRNNLALTIRARAATTTPGDNAYKAIWTDTIKDGQSIYMSYVVIGRGTSGGIWVEEKAGLQDFAGVVSVIGGTGSTLSRRDAALMDEKLSFSGETLTISVRDDGVQPMSWTAFITIVGAG